MSGVGKQEPALAGLDLFEAIESGDAAKIRKLIAHDRAVANARNDEGLSAVLHAMYRGQVEIAAELVMGGADLDVFEAAATGHVERLEELLSHNADQLSAYSADGWTPLGGAHVSRALAMLGGLSTLIAIACSVLPNSNDPHPLQSVLKIVLSSLGACIVGLLFYVWASRTHLRGAAPPIPRVPLS